METEKLQDALNGDVGQIAVIKKKKRRFAILKTSLIPKNYLSLEDSIRQLDAASDNIFLGKIGLGLTEESLRKNQFTPYELVFLELDDSDYYAGKITEIESETCVSIRFRGGHEKATTYYEHLMGYIKANSYSVCGFSKEITLIDYGFTNDKSRFVTELQIPIA